MSIPPWYVVTGGPGSGAGKVIQELAIRGYQTVPEAARVLIDRYEIRGVSSRELRRDEAAFQQRVFRMKLEIEEGIPKDRTVFFERGVPDSIPYYEICGLDYKGIVRVSRGRYRKIFFLEELPEYKQDYARIEDEATARHIGRLLRPRYVELGYDVVDVPVMYTEPRAEFILSHL